MMPECWHVSCSACQTSHPSGAAAFGPALPAVYSLLQTGTFSVLILKVTLILINLWLIKHTVCKAQYDVTRNVTVEL